MLGLGKQGKTLFYRDLRQHLLHSQDQFVRRPGSEGQVMLVFTLPSYPYVFKVIKDVFGPSKDTDRATVESKFAMVKHVDRVGRMADTLEFIDLALPREPLLGRAARPARRARAVDGRGRRPARDPPLLRRAADGAAQHLPRPRHARRARSRGASTTATRSATSRSPTSSRATCSGGTSASRSYGRVVFYDYDEIEYLTDVNFRRIPPAPDPESELAAEPWYGVAPNDVFPEEFATFLLGDPRLREAFLRAPRRPARAGVLAGGPAADRARRDVDFFPYPESLRFRKWAEI